MGGTVEARRALVLVVDDQARLRRTARVLLEQHGFEVVEARHGGEALLACRRYNPALVLLDLEMPAIDGWTFLRIVENAGFDTPVIIVAATEHGSPAESSCVVDVIPKPYDADVLIEAIRRALRE